MTRETCSSCRWRDDVPEREEPPMVIDAHSICRGGTPSARGWPVVEDTDWCRLHEGVLALDAISTDAGARTPDASATAALDRGKR